MVPLSQCVSLAEGTNPRLLEQITAKPIIDALHRTLDFMVPLSQCDSFSGAGMDPKLLDRPTAEPISDALHCALALVVTMSRCVSLTWAGADIKLLKVGAGAQ